MPILPDPEADEPSRYDEARAVLGRVGKVITGSAPVTARLVLFLVVTIIGASAAPPPWEQLALLGLLGVTLEVIARRR